MSTITNTFIQAFNKSIGSIYLDFYLNNEVEFLQTELWQCFEESRTTSPVYTKSYDLKVDDPLLRINLHCIVIVCNSMPFFAANIRSLFHKTNLPINRSLHFHPEKGKEFYYIEIQTKDKEIIDKVITAVHSSYTKIQTLISQFSIFQEKLESLPCIGTSDKSQLVDWLLKKGLVWEGACIQESGKEIEQYGVVADNYHYLEWFNQLKTESDTILLECKETQTESFLGDNPFFCICLIHKDFKILFIGSFTLHAQTLGIIEIPFFSDRFKEFLSKENIEYSSGLGRTVRRIFISLPVEILFLMPETAYLSLFKVIIEQSLKTENRSNGLLINEDLALILTTIPEKNWLESKLNESENLVRDILPQANVKSYHILLTNSVQCYHLIRSNQNSKQKLFEISSQIGLYRNA